MQMNLLIRADSSSQIGLGHIMRDLVLSEQYPGANISFACQKLEGNIIDKIPFQVHILDSGTPEELIALIRSLKINRVIFDHYGIDEAYEKKVKSETKVTIISLDDTYRRHYCDILLNPNIYARSERYKNLVPPHCIIRCGKEFLLIRDEFKEAKRLPRTKTKTVFIAMGGSDPDNLSMKILSFLPDNIPINLVTTSSNPNLEMLQNYVTKHPHICLHVNAANIARIMQQSAFAIVTPSSIAHEVMYLELPFIAIQSAPNQSEFATYLKENGFNAMEQFESEHFKMLLKGLL